MLFGFLNTRVCAIFTQLLGPQFTWMKIVAAHLFAQSPSNSLRINLKFEIEDLWFGMVGKAALKNSNSIKQLVQISELDSLVARRRPGPLSKWCWGHHRDCRTEETLITRSRDQNKYSYCDIQELPFFALINNQITTSCFLFWPGAKWLRKYVA